MSTHGDLGTTALCHSQSSSFGPVLIDVASGQQWSSVLERMSFGMQSLFKSESSPLSCSISSCGEGLDSSQGGGFTWLHTEIVLNTKQIFHF